VTYFAEDPVRMGLLLVRSATFLAGALAFTALIKQFGTGRAAHHEACMIIVYWYTSSSI
jgi:hypothetical protein